MRKIQAASKWLVSGLVLGVSLLTPCHAQEKSREALDQKTKDKIEQLEKPLYNPFVERYILDEIKQTRLDQLEFRNSMMQEVREREVKMVDRAISYVTDAMTYVFYLIAAVSSLLVIVGWNSMRDIKQRAQDIADQKVNELVSVYEDRLMLIEKELRSKSESIEENRQEISRTQEVHSLWLRASQESSPAAKVDIYDEILEINHEDTEAMTYKADAVLELGQPVWALNLCKQALKIDAENAHAHFQAACALSALHQTTEARHHLYKAVTLSSGYLDLIKNDDDLEKLRHEEGFETFYKELEAAVVDVS